MLGGEQPTGRAPRRRCSFGARKRDQGQAGRLGEAGAPCLIAQATIGVLRARQELQGLVHLGY